VVLIGATMPSVLVEISFLTNQQEATLLRGVTYRQQIADALFNGVMRYQRSLKATTEAIASQ
jgi:N-acetylmuramoyl-L-alanine amidase